MSQRQFLSLFPQSPNISSKKAKLVLQHAQTLIKFGELEEIDS